MLDLSPRLFTPGAEWKTEPYWEPSLGPLETSLMTNMFYSILPQDCHSWDWGRVPGKNRCDPSHPSISTTATEPSCTTASHLLVQEEPGSLNHILGHINWYLFKNFNYLGLNLSNGACFICRLNHLCQEFEDFNSLVQNKTRQVITV